MLAEAGHDLGLLNNAQTGLTAVLIALAEAGVTDKSQKDDPKYLCDLSVTAGKVAGQEVGLKWEQRPLDSVIIEPSTHR